MTAPVDKPVATAPASEWDGVCWILANADGTEYEDASGYITPHFHSETAARTFMADVGDDPASQCIPRRLAAPCVTVECARCGYVYDDDNEGVTHWESWEQAVKLLAGDWQFVGRLAWCLECKS